MAIKVKKINDDGKEIVKEIDDGLYSLYLNTGWEVVKNEPKKDLFIKDEKKLPKIEIKEENE